MALVVQETQMPATRFESDIRKLRVSRQFLIVMVLLFVALMVWTFVSIGASQNKTTISKELIELSKPLNPTLDRSVFEDLAQKTFFTPEQIRDFTIYRLLLEADGREQTVVPIDTVIQTTSVPRASQSPLPNNTATPSASPEATINPTPTAEPNN